MYNHQCLSFTKKLLLVLLALLSVYLFICSLTFMSTSFRLIGGQEANHLFSRSEILQNPIVGVMLGVLATVVVQSSSTTTSIVVSMVGSEVIEVRQAIPMIMGANIGTSVTNTLVSLAQMGNRSQFELAFACAVHHDIFNWLAVIVLLPIEIFTSILFETTQFVLKSIDFENNEDGTTPDLLRALTKPLTDKVVQIDSHVLRGWSLGNKTYLKVTSLLKAECTKSQTLPSPIITDKINQNLDKYPCGYLLANTGLSDTILGLVLLICSLILLSLCLLMLVRVLRTLMEAQVTKGITAALNADLPYVPWLTGYLAMIVGIIVTFLVQSSSVFTSILTPMVGTGLFRLERAYPMTLGSNIGTTTTGLLAALASHNDNFHDALQIALCHLFFNLFGIIIFYPIPFMRFPLPLAHRMGRIVYNYRWFAVFYLLLMFLLLPLYIFLLSLINPFALIIGLLPLVLLLVLVGVVSVLQEKFPALLPDWLLTFDFLPEPIRSLEPYDRFVRSLNCCDCWTSVEDEEDLRQSDLEMR